MDTRMELKAIRNMVSDRKSIDPKDRKWLNALLDDIIRNIDVKDSKRFDIPDWLAKKQIGE